MGISPYKVSWEWPQVAGKREPNKYRHNIREEEEEEQRATVVGTHIRLEVGRTKCIK